MAEQEQYYIPFTKEMKENYTILVPNMLPLHFHLILQVFANFGYHMELLETDDSSIIETGLKYVHNDTCYPAILVIGQFISALQSGKYDPHRTALIYFQTGGGCRASNYIHLLRKALKKAELEYVPVISMNLAALEKHPGFKLSVPLLAQLLQAVLYGDLLMSLRNQIAPYEKNAGETDALALRETKALAERMKRDPAMLLKASGIYREILNDFAAIERTGAPKVRVGIVGEIYVKYSPLGNNHLERLLMREGAEVVLPGLLDFLIYCTYGSIYRARAYGTGRAFYPVVRIAYAYLLRKQRQLIAAIRADGRFRAPTTFTHILELSHEVIDAGVCMGEGWLLPAEMLELNDSGVHNIVCAQPFGCLPNHICGKGMMKPLKEKHSEMNLVAIDYDAGATRVNQENRIRLMLSNARKEGQ